MNRPRLNAIGAAAFTLAGLALPTFALPHKPDDMLIHRDTRGELQDVNLADVVATAQDQGSGADGLPTTWCGGETGDDQGVAPGRPYFKVVYAYAADRPDRFAGWKDAIQADVAIVQRFLSAQDGGTKGLRFDMGTSCGAQYVDIQVVPLPGPRSAFRDNFPGVSFAVQRALGRAAGPRDAIVFADGLSGDGQEYGLGESIMGATGEVHGSANVHNRGGLTSVLFSRDGAAAPGAAKWGWWPEGMLHEMTHNLGAVQWGAPHSTEPPGRTLPQYGHCWQGADVMCYAEDGGAAHPMQTDCAGLPGAIPQSYDCGRDDYFNPAPPAGSYLATHWNTYDSAFLAPCGELAPACGGGALWVPAPPAATGGPTVTGDARQGTGLIADPGSWANAPSGYAYQWQRLTASAWGDIGGATGQRYVPSGDDLGRRLRVQVIATNEDGSASAASAATAPVAAGVGRAATTGRKERAEARAKAARKATAAREAKAVRQAKAAQKRRAAARRTARHRAR